MMNVKAKAIIQPEKATNSNQNEENEEKKEKESIENNGSNNASKEVLKKPKRDYSNEIAILMNMGYELEISKKAIKKAKGDVTVAIEFINSGIPLDPNNAIDDNLTLEGTLPKENIFQSLASICKIAGYNNPNYIYNIMEGLNETNPEIVNEIRQKEQEFRNLVSQPINDEDMKIYLQFSGGKRNNLDNIDINNTNTGNNQGYVSTNKEKYNLSDKEYESIVRLKDFGFSEIECIQAYLACDKNEEYSLNLLFDNKTKVNPNENTNSNANNNQNNINNSNNNQNNINNSNNNQNNINNSNNNNSNGSSNNNEDK